MELVIAAVGQRMPAWVHAGYEEYARRMPPELRLVLKEVKAEPREGGRTAQQMMEAEGRRLLAAVPPGSIRVVLDEKGRDVTTVQLASLLTGWQREARAVAFIIGGPDGLSADVKATASATLRLSALTLPHPMVRVVLAEQLYRAWTIMTSHPYHRA